MTDLELLRYMKEGIGEEEAKGIEKMVYLYYPKTKKEKECRTEKNNRDEMRELRRKRLIKETKEKREITISDEPNKIFKSGWIETN